MSDTMKIYLKLFLTLLLCFSSSLANSIGQQDSNDCRTTTGQFCERSGSCSVQGADWYQYVTIDKNDIFDTQGWPGVCDMVHVALVQGNCSPPQSTINVTAYLSNTTFASTPEIIGQLSCNAELIADGDVAPLGAPDGITNAGDLLIMTRIVLGAHSPDANTIAHGDIYPSGAPDGVINISDLIRMYPLIIAP